MAGSSLIVLRKTSAAPARIPERASGRTTAVVARTGPRPSERAASSRRGTHGVERRAGRCEAVRHEANDVGEDEETEALVQRRADPRAHEDECQRDSDSWERAREQGQPLEPAGHHGRVAPREERRGQHDERRDHGSRRRHPGRARRRRPRDRRATGDRIGADRPPDEHADGENQEDTDDERAEPERRPSPGAELHRRRGTSRPGRAPVDRAAQPPTRGDEHDRESERDEDQGEDRRRLQREQRLVPHVDPGRQGRVAHERDDPESERT